MPDLPMIQLPASLSRYHHLLENAFDLDEFRTLCLQLQVRYDDLSGGNLSAKMRELLLHLDRTKRIEQLIAVAEEMRPLTDWHSRPTPDVECPYKGLHAFREEDANNFFGRQAFADLLQKAVHNQPLVAVIGPSGSGKSSVVFAGLMPTLRQEGNWLITDFRPGVDPFTSLAHVLLPMLEPDVSPIDRPPKTRRLATHLRSGDAVLSDYLNIILQEQPTAQMLLFCDQFEELYTQVTEVNQRRKFLDTLLEGFCHPDKVNNATLIITLRADFLGQVLAYPEMVSALQDRDIKIGLMSPDELETAIVQPAANAGVGFADGLVNRILKDVGDHAGNLPLLEFALTLLWERQTDAEMTHTAYEEIGGVSGALARHADETVARLTYDDPALEEAIQRVMVQLVHPGAGAEDTRRIAHRNDLGEAGWAIVPQLADARLLITNLVNQTDEDPTANTETATTETVEVIHEALIQHWGRLQEWMEHDREFRMWQERLRADLSLWLENERQDGFLLQSAPLTFAADWLDKRPVDLSNGEIDFIEASLQKRHEREETEEARRQYELEQTKQLAEEQRKGRIRLRQIVGVLALGLLAAAVLTVLLINSNQTAKENEATAEENAAAAETSAAKEIAARETSDANVVLAQASKADAEIAATAEANARLEAEIALNLANARYLVNQGQALFEEDPLLSLAMVVEGLYLASQQAHEKLVFAESHEEVFKWGRTAVLGLGVESLTPSPAETMLLMTNDNRTSTLIDNNGEAKVVFANEIESWEINPQETWLLVDYLNINVADELHDLTKDIVIPLEQELSFGGFYADGNWLLIESYDDVSSTSTVNLYDLSDDGKPLLTFEEVGWEFIADESWLIIASWREDESNELINLTDGRTISLAGRVESWQYDPGGNWLLVDYLDPDLSDELRSLSNNEITQFATELEFSEFNFDGTWLLVNYADANVPSELRQLNGRHIIPLAGEVENWGVSFKDNWLIIDYLDAPGETLQDELHNLTNDTIIRLVNEVDTWSFNQNETWLLIDYSDARVPDELRDLTLPVDNILPIAYETDIWGFSPDSDSLVIKYLRDDSSGALLDLRSNQSITLTGEIERWEFSADGSWLLVDNLGAPGTLYNHSTVIPLSAEIENWLFSPHGEWLFLDFVNARGTLLDTVSKRFVPLSGEVENWGFSPNQAWFLLDYVNYSGELFDTTTGSITGSFFPLADEVDAWEFNSNETRLMVDYVADFGNTKVLGEIRDLTNSQVLTSFSSEVIWWDLPQNEDWLVVQYSRYISEIWQATNGYLLTPLGGNLKNIYFFSTGNIVVVQYYDGRAYLLDLQWLEAMNESGIFDPVKELDATDIQTLIDLACQYPLENGAALDQPELRDGLQPYLEQVGQTEPQACKP